MSRCCLWIRIIRWKGQEDIANNFSGQLQHQQARFWFLAAVIMRHVISNAVIERIPSRAAGVRRNEKKISVDCNALLPLSTTIHPWGTEAKVRLWNRGRLKSKFAALGCCLFPRRRRRKSLLSSWAWRPWPNNRRCTTIQPSDDHGPPAQKVARSPATGLILTRPRHVHTGDLLQRTRTWEQSKMQHMDTFLKMVCIIRWYRIACIFHSILMMPTPSRGYMQTSAYSTSLAHFQVRLEYVFLCNPK